MPSCSTTERRFFAELGRSALALGAGTLVLAVGCSRDADKTRASAPRSEDTALRAAPAAEAAPIASTTEPRAAPDSANSGAEAAAGEPPTASAEQLLAEVRRLGGKGTLVNAWASWCGPCKEEVPMLARLATDFAPRGIHVLLVSLDEPDAHQKALEFLQQRGIKLPLYFAERPLGAFKRGMNPRWPGMLPASFLFDATGQLRYFWGGEAFEQELTPVIASLIAGQPIDGESAAQVAPEGEVH